MFAQPHAEAGCTEMAAVLVGAEVSMVQVFGEVDVAESIATAQSKLVIVPGEPAQRFSPLALAMIAVRVVRERKASGHGKVVGTVIEPAVPAFRQQVKQRGIKSRRNGIAGEAARER